MDGLIKALANLRVAMRAMRMSGDAVITVSVADFCALKNSIKSHHERGLIFIPRGHNIGNEVMINGITIRCENEQKKL